MNITALWDSLVDAICRPPRDVYQIGELVGGRRGYCKLQGRTIVREDLTLVNPKGQKLQCSHYKPSDTTAEHGRPIVIYCHCNSGSRRDAEEAFYILLPRDVTVFCLDFAGSGLSDGDWVTLGAHEVEDLATVVKHLRNTFPESAIGLWGRSMGAVTALMYTQRDPSIAGVVMDSPFAQLTELMMELVDEQKVPIPKPFMRVALGMMRRSVRKRAGFNIDDVAPLCHVSACFIPALFGHATEDTFVSKKHSQRLHDAYAGEKDFVTFKGDHNSVRPNQFYHSALIFLLRALRWEHPLVSPKGCLPPKSPVLMEMEAREKMGRSGSGRLDLERTDSGGRAECATPTQSQRELAPPWNFEDTEQQIEIMKDLAVSSRRLDLHAQAVPLSNHSSHHLAPAANLGADLHDQATPNGRADPCQAAPWVLEPPPPMERAPWLLPDQGGTGTDEKIEVVGSSPGESQYLTATGKARAGYESCQIPAWAPARLARQLFEESVAGGRVAELPMKPEEHEGGTARPSTRTEDVTLRGAVPNGESRMGGNEPQASAKTQLLGELWADLSPPNAQHSNGSPGRVSVPRINVPSDMSAQRGSDLLLGGPPSGGADSELRPENLSSGGRHHQEVSGLLPGDSSPGDAAVQHLSKPSPQAGLPYREHGPRQPVTEREAKPREPTLEERFWQFTPDLAESDESDDSMEERALARAIEASIRDQGGQQQNFSSAVNQTKSPSFETAARDFIPPRVHNISQEEAEEMMLVEAIKASLAEAAKNGLVDASPQNSQELPVMPSQMSERSQGEDTGRYRSRALFWRRKDSNGKRITSPAKGVAGHNIR